MKQQHQAHNASRGASAQDQQEISRGELAVRAFSGQPDACVLHIDATTHEQGSSGKVHSYRADYILGEDAIMWMAEVEVDRTSRTFAGSMPLTTDGAAALAEQAVRDAVIRAIDGIDEASTDVARPPPSPGPGE